MFIASFILTVTAFAADIFPTPGSAYYNTYDEKTNYYAFVKVTEQKASVYAYYADNCGSYVSGSTNDGFMTNSRYVFTFSTALGCSSSGTLNGQKYYDLTVEGKTVVRLGAGFLGTAPMIIRLLQFTESDSDPSQVFEWRK